MNKFLVALSFTAACLALNTEPAQGGHDRGRHNNFVATVQLDTSQVEAPAPFTSRDYFCWTSTYDTEFTCRPAAKVNPRVFNDPRITDIQVVTLP